MKHMKTVLFLAVLVTLFVLTFTTPASAYMPVYDQMGDITPYDGSDIARDGPIITDTADGVNLKFKFYPNMWANRVVAGGNYNIKQDADPLKVGYTADKEGIYLRLTNLKWDVPPKSLSVPKPQTGIAIAITAGRGGWVDGKALLFWIIRKPGDQYQIAILRGRESSETAGMSSEESTENFFAMKYTDLPEPIGSEINFYIRRTGNNEWTFNINGNKFKLDESKTIKDRFVDPSVLNVSLGTWTSSAAVEYTVNEIWSYGCVEYSKKVSGKNVRNPIPAFVAQMKKEDNSANTPSKPIVSGNTSSKATNNQSSTGTESRNDGGNVSSEALNSSESSSLVSTDDSSSETAESTVSGSESSSPGETSEDKDESSILVPVIIGAIVVVLVGGGVLFYFMFLKKKPE